MKETTARLSILSLRRRLSTGNIEELAFDFGVNVLVGPPNTGKTKWLETLDFLLADPGENPFAGAEETGLSEKYDAASATIQVGEATYEIERRWKEVGAKTKIFVDGEPFPAREFQHWLMEKLSIPLLHFPKGNPMSGQTWPELSFRMLLRHVYRQQRFWGDLADRQPEGEQHACVMQLLGLAETIYTKDYGDLISLKRQAEELKSGHVAYFRALEGLAQDVLSATGATVGVSASTVKAAQTKVTQEIADLQREKIEILASARDSAIESDRRGRLTELGKLKAEKLVVLEESRKRCEATLERLAEVKVYRSELSTEAERLDRAEDAGRIFADLKITHCPACDQTVQETRSATDHCFLCHQSLPDEVFLEQLGTTRIKFESERLKGELEEANELIELLVAEVGRFKNDIRLLEEQLNQVETELAPSRDAVGALAQDDISSVDVELGRASERQRQINRLSASVSVGEEMLKTVEEIETRISPLQSKVDEAARKTDFENAGWILEEGMNEYLSAVNALKPGTWRHNPVRVSISRSSFNLKVGGRKWSSVLGGTDTLFFLMAYHYGLLSLNTVDGAHYPGISIIDVPGEFSGEEIKDQENFVVQPFIDLLAREEFADCQLIMTGASFEGLQNVRRLHQGDVFTF